MSTNKQCSSCGGACRGLHCERRDDRPPISLVELQLEIARLHDENHRLGEQNDVLLAERCVLDSGGKRLTNAVLVSTDKLRELQQRSAWQPIERAPEETVVVVFWLDKNDEESPERYAFDYMEDGCWREHEDAYEHFCSVAPAGSAGPGPDAPYTHWMLLLPPSEKRG